MKICQGISWPNSNYFIIMEKIISFKIITTSRFDFIYINYFKDNQLTK